MFLRLIHQSTAPTTITKNLKLKTYIIIYKRLEGVLINDGIHY